MNVDICPNHPQKYISQQSFSKLYALRGKWCLLHIWKTEHSTCGCSHMDFKLKNRKPFFYILHLPWSARPPRFMQRGIHWSNKCCSQMGIHQQPWESPGNGWYPFKHSALSPRESPCIGRANQWPSAIKMYHWSALLGSLRQWGGWRLTINFTTWLRSAPNMGWIELSRHSRTYFRQK